MILILAEVKELAKGLRSKLPYSVQELVLSSYFYLKSSRIHGATFAAKRGELEKSEHFSPDQLNELQSRLLRRTIAAAGHTRHYNELFRRFGIDPQEIRTPEDLRSLPLLEKDAVRRNPEAFVDGRLNRRRLHVDLQSGAPERRGQVPRVVRVAFDD